MRPKIKFQKKMEKQTDATLIMSQHATLKENATTCAQSIAIENFTHAYVFWRILRNWCFTPGY